MHNLLLMCGVFIKVHANRRRQHGKNWRLWSYSWWISLFAALVIPAIIAGLVSRIAWIGLHAMLESRPSSKMGHTCCTATVSETHSTHKLLSY